MDKASRPPSPQFLLKFLHIADNRERVQVVCIECSQRKIHRTAHLHGLVGTNQYHRIWIFKHEDGGGTKLKVEEELQ